MTTRVLTTRVSPTTLHRADQQQDDAKTSARQSAFGPKYTALARKYHTTGPNNARNARKACHASTMAQRRQLRPMRLAWLAITASMMIARVIVTSCLQHRLRCIP